MGQSYGTDTGLRGSSFPGGQYYCMFVCWWGPRPSGEAALKTQGNCWTDILAGERMEFTARQGRQNVRAQRQVPY